MNLRQIKARCTVTPGGCWEWQGGHGRVPWNYGEVIVQGRRWRVHRLTYTLAKGPIPKGLFVCHACDNPPCCNPKHLWVGSQGQNIRDARSKNRHYRGAKTHCRRGHPLSGDNLRVSRLGFRNCKACSRIMQRIKAGWPEADAESVPPIPAGAVTARRVFGKRLSHTTTPSQEGP